MNGVDLPAAAMMAPVACYAAGIVATIAASGRAARAARALPSLLTMAGGLVGIAVAVNALLDGATETLDGWAIVPFARMAFRLDPLAAFFLLVISLPAIAAAWYGLGYLDAAHAGDRHHDATRRGGVDAAFAAFVAAMTLVVLADGVLGFLLAWELMSLVSFFLVIGDGNHADARRAGFVYAVMTHIGTGFLLLAFLVLSRHAGSLDFAAFRAVAPALGRWERDAVFALALLGFGTKAGLIPLHVWLPRAHPAAPSHVSALMSGVMVKTAIYGLLRVIWEFAGNGPGWWGGVLVAAGAVSAVLGILYALMERDLKRVLAYSTVEHVGIIAMGVGAAAMLDAGGHDEAAALALVAALVHLLNHALFKGLLFMGAGAIQTATGTRDLERLGGLIRAMPRLAALFLVGSIAIAALPPLNGFAGEWLLFQALLQLGGLENNAGLATFGAVAAGALALTGALALACFVRAFGVGFLAQPRSDAARAAREVGLSMQLGMAVTALCCVLFGVWPGALFRLLRPVTNQLANATAHPTLGMSGLLDADRVTGAYAPIMVVAGLVVVGVVPWLIARLIGGPGRTRTAPTWVCGVALEPRMQYSATAFAKPIRLIFKTLVQPRRAVDLDRPSSPYFVTAVRYEERLHPIYERYLYDWGVRLVVGASRRIRRLQSGAIRAYLAYIFVTLVVVLILAR